MVNTFQDTDIERIFIRREACSREIQQDIEATGGHPVLFALDEFFKKAKAHEEQDQLERAIAEMLSTETL